MDWDQRQLTLKLNRVPEDGYVERFRRPLRTMYTYGEFHPGSFKFIGDSAHVSGVADSRVQGVVDLFKARLDVARAEFHEDLERIALQENEARQTALRAQQARAEQRAAVLRSVKI